MQQSRESIVHESGRRLIPTDNSPAHWIFANAISNISYSIEEIAEQIDNHLIPFEYTKINKDFNLNNKGWKVCHIESVGLNIRTPIENISLDILKIKSKLFLLPSNIFLIPKEWGGLAEIPSFLKGFREVQDETINQ